MVYPLGVGSRAGTDLDTVLLDYTPGVDYDQSLVEDLEGIRTRLRSEGLSMLEQRTDGRSFTIDSAGVTAEPFLRNAVNAHRAISFQLIPADDRQGSLAVGAGPGGVDFRGGGAVSTDRVTAVCAVCAVCVVGVGR